jgi:hypothetical protein
MNNWKLRCCSARNRVDTTPEAFPLPRLNNLFYEVIGLTQSTESRIQRQVSGTLAHPKYQLHVASVGADFTSVPATPNLQFQCQLVKSKTDPKIVAA